MKEKFNYNINKDKKEIALLFKKYVQIILNEYKNVIPNGMKEHLNKTTDFSNYVQIEDTKTISLFATKDGVIHLPLDAYKAINILATSKEYGSIKSHKTHNELDMIINNNTFRDFVEHIILKGATPLDYFKKILLHEVMHVCGSHGASAIAEGFNELKTREVAQKYGLETSCCGYPKETKIAYELQQLFGLDICNQLTFANFETRLDILKNELGEEAKNLYLNVYSSMEQEFRPYMDRNYSGINGINEKCTQYDKIDYTETFNYINQYKERNYK